MALDFEGDEGNHAMASIVPWARVLAAVAIVRLDARHLAGATRECPEPPHFYVVHSTTIGN